MLDLRSFPDFDGHKLVTMIHDRATGLYGFIAIHNDALGPALGGTRMRPYENDRDAITDVLRLSRGMSFKAALAGVATGGGKAVLIGNPDTDKSEAYFRAYGKIIDYFGGRFITGEDVNITVEDIEIVAQETEHATGRAEEAGGGGDPSPITASGVFHGIRACLKEAYGDERYAHRKFAVQGAGKVGYHLIKKLYGAHGHVFVSDVNPRALERVKRDFPDITIVSPDEIHLQDVDVFSPCALGAGLNEHTIPQLRCKIVAGAANNQLATDEDGQRLYERGILYAPDYAINAGGLISVTEELQPDGYKYYRAKRKTARIFETVKNIIVRSRRDNRPTNVVADHMAQEILDEAAQKNIGNEQHT